MLASEIVSTVQMYVSASRFTSDDILDIVNQGMTVVSGGGDRPHGLPLLAPLPDLASSATVTITAAANSVSMPSTYQRGVIKVIDANGDILTKAQSYFDLIGDYPTLETGSTDMYFVRGNTLFYAPSKDQDLTVFFYRKPVDMDMDEEPDGLPAQFHEKILCNYAAMRLYKSIDDSAEQSGRNNSEYYRKEYLNGLTDLERFIGPEELGYEQVSDGADYVMGWNWE